jgi:hypothetical protein
LAAQQARIDACFRRKGRALTAPAEVQLAFDVDATGEPLQVSLTPPSLANTPFGRCLHTVGMGARFPASAEARSFHLSVAASE